MIDPRGAFDHVNRALVAAIALTVAGAATFALAVSNPAIATLEQALEQAERRQGDFERSAADLGELGPEERAAWARQWHALEEHVDGIADEPALIARVAAQLRRAGVHELEVARSRGIAPDATSTAGQTLDQPGGDGTMRVEAVPITVRLAADAEPLRDILGEFDRGVLPFRLERLELMRRNDGVQLHADGIFFHRGTAR